MFTSAGHQRKQRHQNMENTVVLCLFACFVVLLLSASPMDAHFAGRRSGGPHLNSTNASTSDENETDGLNRTGNTFGHVREDRFRRWAMQQNDGNGTHSPHRIGHWHQHMLNSTNSISANCTHWHRVGAQNGTAFNRTGGVPAAISRPANSQRFRRRSFRRNETSNSNGSDWWRGSSGRGFGGGQIGSSNFGETSGGFGPFGGGNSRSGSGRIGGGGGNFASGGEFGQQGSAFGTTGNGFGPFGGQSGAERGRGARNGFGRGGQIGGGFGGQFGSSNGQIGFGGF